MEFLAILGIFLLIGSTVFLYVHSKKKNRDVQVRGILWLGHLRVFIARVQKHRGMTTAYINGSKDRAREIEQLSWDISEDIKKIERVGSWIVNNENWNSIAEHWARLASGYKTNENPGNNLTQHSRLIQNTLYLVEEMADEHGLLQIKGSQSASIEFLWKDLLHAIEYLGQARAVGSGITAKHSCSSVERIKMNYLHRKIEENCFSVTQFLPEGDIAEREVRSFLSTIQRDVLAHKCVLDTSQYFDMATKTIEFLYDQFDKTIERAARPS